MATGDLRVLHVYGARGSEFYHDLSQLYAEAVIRPPGTTHAFANVRPDGGWRIGTEIDALGPPMVLADALSHLPPADLVVPHMFCPAGMTTYRALFEDLLGIPVVGSPAAVTGLATRKSWTRDVLLAAGVAVPAGGPILDGKLPDGLAPPLVVKPDAEDNSRGLTIVREAAEVPGAIAVATAFGPAIAERFVPGRELRVAVIETEGRLHVPPMIEYPVTDARPVRAVEDKLALSRDGTPMAQADRAEVQPVCPADVAPDLAARLADAARSAHRALGARDYSLFDVRVDAASGTPLFLEAGLFWSFSRLSAITKMLLAEGTDVPHIIGRLWRDAAGRSRDGVARAAIPAVERRGQQGGKT